MATVAPRSVFIAEISHKLQQPGPDFFIHILFTNIGSEPNYRVRRIKHKTNKINSRSIFLTVLL